MQTPVECSAGRSHAGLWNGNQVDAAHVMPASPRRGETGTPKAERSLLDAPISKDIIFMRFTPRPRMKQPSAPSPARAPSGFIVLGRSASLSSQIVVDV